QAVPRAQFSNPAAWSPPARASSALSTASAQFDGLVADLDPLDAHLRRAVAAHVAGQRHPLPLVDLLKGEAARGHSRHRGKHDIPLLVLPVHLGRAVWVAPD